MELKTLSLFCGAGGLSSGFKNAGFTPTLAVEIDAEAAASYRANIGSECLGRDLASQGTLAEIYDRFEQDRPLIIIGGPPCQGFSTAGARDPDDPRNRLIFSYLDIISHLRPRWFLFENVEGLLTSNGGRSLRNLTARFIELGYSLALAKLNFVGLGLPQTRKRVVIVGNSVGIAFKFPPYGFFLDSGKHRVRGGHLPARTLSDALKGLAQPSVFETPAQYLTPAEPDTYGWLMRSSNGTPVTRHKIPRLSASDATRVSQLKPGQGLRHIPESYWPESFRSRAYRRVRDGLPTHKRGGAPNGLRRLRADEPSLTITSLASKELIHPTDDRPLTLRECARLQSFPDDYQFFGNDSSVARQIGNAVPPLIAIQLAKAILDAEDRSERTSVFFSFSLSDSTGRSPALAQTESLLSALVVASPESQTLFPIEEFGAVVSLSNILTPSQRTLITSCRSAPPVRMSDRELARLLSVLLRDIGMSSLIPSWIAVLDGRSYYEIELTWFTQDEQREFTFSNFFLQLSSAVEDFELLFRSLTEIHKRRRKFDAILRNQALPSMDQVARKGLLEFGIFPSPSLTSWLVWRKWIYDIDNRSAQETGYLFEPILAGALGGRPFGSRSSPIRRLTGEGRRQVDCIVDLDDERLAYEFKVRVTIASSGQGRWGEELAFPEEASKSGFTPILLVLDPTPNDKLMELTERFRRAGGSTYLGEAAWKHLENKAGEAMQRFIELYVRTPLASIVRDEQQVPLDAKLHWSSDHKSVSLMIGEAVFEIPRNEGPLIIDDPLETEEER